jgi:hypothetical protein
MMQSAEDRAVAILKAMDAEPASKAASGRYVRARDKRPGVRLWATTQQRYHQDLVGVQFYGRSREEGEVLAPLLERNGFKQRTPQAGQLTFAKPVDYAADGRIDAAAVAAVRRQIEGLINGAASKAEPDAPQSFRAFMLGSPLSEVELPVTSRKGEWRESQV